jgi:glycosyltransferase involved in cell wall biosynthesis
MTPEKTDTSTPVFIVSSYEVTNGILRFVSEQVQSRIKQGHTVTRVSLTPSSHSDLSFDLQTCSGAVHWLWFSLKPKRALTILHYYNAIVFPKHRNPGLLSSPFLKLLQIMALAALPRTSSGSAVYFHEIETGVGIGWRRRAIINFCLRPFNSLNFYNNAFREKVVNTYSSLQSVPYSIEDHSQHMTRLFSGSQGEARSLLNIPQKPVVFLCLGFISHSKGFDIAVKAFCKASPNNALLHIVGSSGNQKEAADYSAELRSLSEKNGNVLITHQFVDDSTFDCWLQAADVVILPYRSISSSGVGARALVYEKSLVISDLPSLKESFPNGTIFRDETHLAEILRDFAATIKT